MLATLLPMEGPLWGRIVKTHCEDRSRLSLRNRHSRSAGPGQGKICVTDLRKALIARLYMSGPRHAGRLLSHRIVSAMAVMLPQRLTKLATQPNNRSPFSIVLWRVFPNTILWMAGRSVDEHLG
jgi:hypothetical protein